MMIFTVILAWSLYQTMNQISELRERSDRLIRLLKARSEKPNPFFKD